ncbi:MAG: LTA synthase family protein [Clostridiales bacterium]|jgi:phosphoglycerol transferase MdoB-like AlkP superfamily enzyme|nr:LTA synthase family protein [Clostridiales bacterium]
MIRQLWDIINNAAQKRRAQWALRAYACVLPLFVFLILEGLNPASVEGLMAAPLSNLGVVLLSALFIALCAVAVFTLTGSAFWSYAIVSAVLGGAYVINNLKVMIAGQVFVPTDLMLAGEALMITRDTDIIIEMTLLLRLALVAVLHLPLIFLKFKPGFTKRWLMFCGAVAAFVLAFASNFYNDVIMPALEIHPRGPLTALYRDTGFILGFHAAAMDHAARNLEAATAGPRAMQFFEEPRRGGVMPPYDGGGGGGVMPPYTRPNVIVVMSEAFMDPNVIYNLEFSTNPVSNLHRLSADHISGDVIVPVFGGGTANTELEFLTGSPLFFMGSAYYVPYSNTGRYFFRDIQTAMPHLFRANGYRAVAVHPFTRYFFARGLVYPRLGFEDFIAYEDMDLGEYFYDKLGRLVTPAYKGLYVSDEFFTDEIIAQILLAEEDGQPLFLFGISMQNHWEYWGNKYYGWPQDVTSYSPFLNEEELARVDAFVQGIYDADKQLGRLIDFIEARDTPTIVVFFGDHMPIMGLHTDRFFQDLGFISDHRPGMWNEDDRRKMFSMPYLVWSNFAPTDEDWGTLSTYFLGAQMLRHSGIYLNRYWHHVLYASRYFSALTENHYVDIHENFRNVWSVWNYDHVIAMEALTQAMWFGTDDFHYSLSEIIRN